MNAENGRFIGGMSSTVGAHSTPKVPENANIFMTFEQMARTWKKPKEKVEKEE